MDLPKETVIPIDAPFCDMRGVIQNVLHQPIGAVVVIHSKPNSTRARHWHKEDWHFCYVMSGSIDYFERPLDSTEPPKLTKLRAGQLFFTPSGVEHEMFFPEETTFLTLANRHRTPEDYEHDLVRLTVSLRDAYLASQR